MRVFAVMVSVLLILSAGVRAQDPPVAEGAAVTPPANEYHGTVGCSKCDFGDKAETGECLAALKTADGVYLLKPAQTAPPAVRSFLDRIRDGQLKGEYLCKGEVSELDGKKWLAVASMVAKPLPKASSANPLAFSTDRKRTTGGAAGDTKAGDGGGGDGGGDGGGRRRGRGHRHGGGDEGGGGGEEGQ